MTVHTGLKLYYCTNWTEGIWLYTLDWRYIIVHTGLKVYYCTHWTEGILLYKLNWRYIIVHTELKVYYCTHWTEGILLNTLNGRYIIVHTGLKVYYCTHWTVGILLFILNFRHVTVHTEPEAYYILSEMFGISRTVDILLCTQAVVLNRGVGRRESLRPITLKIRQRVAVLKLIKLWTSGFLHVPCSWNSESVGGVKFEGTLHPTTWYECT